MPFETFIICDNLYQGYLQTQDDNLLDQLGATFYGKKIRALTKGDVTKESEVLALDTHRAHTELNAQAREYKELKSMKS